MSRGVLPRRLPLVLVRIGRRHPRTIMVGAALVWVVTILLATTVQVDTDILSLVPRDNAVVQDFKHTIERFGSVDTLLVVVRLDPARPLEPQLDFADLLAAELERWDAVDWVQYRISPELEMVIPLLGRATLFMEPAEVRALVDRLRPEAAAGQARRLKAELMAPQSMVTKHLLRLDPLGLVPDILDRISFGGVGAKVDAETGCLISEDGSALLMVAKPVAPAQDLAFNEMLVAGLEDRVEAAASEWRAQGRKEEAPGAEFTGGYVVALEDAQLITSDAVVGLTSSLIGVMFIFLLAFRRRAAVLYAFFPLATGLGLAFAFVAVALGRLNSLTSAFGGLLIGLGIDFVIVLYGRYVEERHRGADHDTAVDAMGRHTGVGVLLGAVTTAGTFFAFLVTEFRGLWELGLLTGVGILLVVGTVFLLLPAMLTTLAARRPGTERLYLHSFGSDMVCRASLARPLLTLGVIVVVSLGLGAAMTRLEFDDDIRNMRSPDNRGIALREEVMNTFGLRFSPMTVRVDGATESEALGAARRLLPELKRLVDEGVLAGIDTVAGVVPSEEAQREAIRILRSADVDWERARSDLESALMENGLNPRAFDRGFDLLGEAVSVERPLLLSDLEGTTLEQMSGRYLARHPGGVSTAIYCYPPAGKWRRMSPPPLVEVVAAEPAASLTGINIVSEELRRIVWDDAIGAALLGLVVVFLLLWADLGGPLRSLLALIPLLVGMVWMLGGMACLGARVNFMNIFVVTMVIGIGVDYGVHLLHRWIESGGSPEAVAETAKAIAVAALTTMVGFGSFILSHYPGLRSVGVAAILGAVATAVLSITLLPVLLSRLVQMGENVAAGQRAQRGSDAT